MNENKSNWPSMNEITGDTFRHAIADEGIFHKNALGQYEPCTGPDSDTPADWCCTQNYRANAGSSRKP